MPLESFSWLHLTDFHFGLRGQKFLWPTLRQPFLDDLARLHKLSGPWHAVLFTGDLVQQGKSEEFLEMQKEVLDLLWAELHELGSGDAVLLAVPGNHDLYRPDPNGDNPAVDALLEKDGFARIASKFWDSPTGSYRRVITDSLAAYSEWWESTPHRPKKDVVAGSLPGDFSCTLEVGGRRIGIAGLNTAFLQLAGGEYRGRLVWEARQLQKVCGGAADAWVNRHNVCLLLTHQSPDWLTPEARKHGENEIAPAGRFAAHLFGHMHEGDVTYTRKGGSAETSRLCQGCSAFGMERSGEPPTTTRRHGYAAGRIAFGKNGATLRIWPRAATDRPDGWRYVADNELYVLKPDQGTEPEHIPVRDLGAPSSAAPTGKRAPRPRKAAAGGHFLPVAAHSTLPSRRAFFGREKELAAIARALRPEHVGWGAVLDGPGGIGKTALAIEAAHRAPAEQYPLKLFITAKGRQLDPEGEHELRDHRVASYSELLSEIGLGLGRQDVAKNTPDRRPDLVRHALAEHRVLLVLDNVESLTAMERRRLYDLLEALPRTCRAIVTTRRRDETAARTLRLDKLDPGAASQLLDSLGRNWPPIAKLTPDERGRLYAETGGNPLLLTWTAGQLGRARGRCHTVEDAVVRLNEAHRLQKVNERNDPLEFIFGDLLDTFTADEMAVLAALAHFSGPAHVAWLLPLAGLSETAALTALDDLHNRALLVEDDAAGTWTLPPLAARFLRRRRPRAIGAAGRRLEREAYALAMQHGGDDNYPFTELEAAWPTIQAALPLLIGGDSARLLEVCSALTVFLDYTGRWDESLSLFQEAEAKAVACGDWYSAGWCASQAAWVHSLRGEADAVLVCTRRLAAHWRRTGAKELAGAHASELRGHAHLIRRNYASAIAAYQKALAFWRSSDPGSLDVANQLCNLGIAEYERRELDGAGDCLDHAEGLWREALRIYSKLRDRSGIAACTGNLADVFLARENWAAAERQASRALRLSGDLGRQELIAENHRQLADAMLHLNRAAEALHHAQEAVAIFSRLRAPDLAEARVTLAACEAAISSPAVRSRPGS